MEKTSFFQVTFVIDRKCDEMDASDLWDEVEVELMKKPGKGLGISVVGKKEANGIFVSDMVRAEWESVFSRFVGTQEPR